MVEILNKGKKKKKRIFTELRATDNLKTTRSIKTDKNERHKNTMDKKLSKNDRNFNSKSHS